MKTKLFFIALTASLFAISSCQKVDVNPLEKTDQSVSGAQLASNAQPASGSKEKKSGFTGDCVPVQAILINEDNSSAGTLTVSNASDLGFIYVTYTCENDWSLVQTELYVGDCDLIPIGADGTPDIANYPSVTTHNNVTSYTYEIPMSFIPAGNTGCISAHATVVNSSNQSLSSWGINKTLGHSGSDKDSYSFKYYSCF